MRLPALFALAALVGLSACDSAKVSELTGAKPAKTQIATTACPPAATVAPVCPPAQPSMAPEAPKAAPPAAKPVTPAPAPPVRPARAHVKAHAWTQQRHQAKPMRVVKHHHSNQPPVRRFAYAGGYTGETAPPPRHHAYVRPQHHAEAYVERRYATPDDAYSRDAYRYERRQDGYAQDDYRYERRESGHAPYVDERGYGYERREGSVERSGSSYEHRESGYSSGSYSSGSYASGGGVSGDDCGCRPQAAGRDRQGFLTWPGKR